MLCKSGNVVPGVWRGLKVGEGQEAGSSQSLLPRGNTLRQDDAQTE